jgi:transcriptional regulator
MTLNTVTKSDNLIFMKRTLTATEAARNFSALLDSVEAGDEIEITRGKKVIAVIKQGEVSRSLEGFPSQVWAA